MKNLKLNTGKDLYPNSNWIVGTYQYRSEDYRFNAKINTIPSTFGINNGKILKLWVKNERTNKVVFSYDRGYDIGDESRTSYGMIKNLIDFVNNYTINYGT